MKLENYFFDCGDGENIYREVVDKLEKAFVKSDRTDAILVVRGKKLHVNKAVLSYHSDYFKKLFNSDFKNESMEEIEIKDVNFHIFATVLSLVHGGPIKCSTYYFEKYLDLADRFQLPAAKRHLEQFLISSNRYRFGFIRIAEKYQLDDLMDIALSQLNREDYYSYDTRIEDLLPRFKDFSDETNIKLFHRLLEIKNGTKRLPNVKVSQLSIYESTFAKTDKTDAILVVDGKKLHVNKAVLSHHSDYFNVMFNSDFKEKSMKEIEIKNVDFENFATLLSIVHLNPIAPANKETAMKIVELSVPFFIPCVKQFLEPFIYSSPLSNMEKIRIGELYDNQKLCQEGIDALKLEDFSDLPNNLTYQALSSAAKKNIFFKSLALYL
ncbi:unnamed protein product [Caenorhabditis brenneri]